MVATPELRQVEAPKDTVATVNLKESTNEQLEEIADGIVKDSNAENQVKKEFPDSWNLLNYEEKSELASRLTSEIKDSIAELGDVGVEYSSEVTKIDEERVEALQFVINNHEKIPQLWAHFVNKANEITKDMGKEIDDRGILDTGNMA